MDVLAVADQMDRLDRSGSHGLHADLLILRSRESFAHEVFAEPELQYDVVGRAVSAALENRVENRLPRL